MGTWKISSVIGKGEELSEEMDKFGIGIIGLNETKKIGNGVIKML